MSENKGYFWNPNIKDNAIGTVIGAFILGIPTTLYVVLPYFFDGTFDEYLAKSFHFGFSVTVGQLSLWTTIILLTGIISFWIYRKRKSNRVVMKAIYNKDEVALKKEWDDELQIFMRTPEYKYFGKVYDSTKDFSFDSLEYSVKEAYKSNGLVFHYNFTGISHTSFTVKGEYFARKFLENQYKISKEKPKKLESSQTKEQEYEEFYLAFKRTRAFLFFDKIINCCDSGHAITEYPNDIRSYYKSQGIIVQNVQGMIDWKYKFTELGRYLQKKYDMERMEGTLTKSLHTMWKNDYEIFKKSNMFKEFPKFINSSKLDKTLTFKDGNTSKKYFDEQGFYEYVEENGSTVKIKFNEKGEYFFTQYEKDNHNASAAPTGEILQEVKDHKFEKYYSIFKTSDVYKEFPDILKKIDSGFDFKFYVYKDVLNYILTQDIIKEYLTGWIFTEKGEYYKKRYYEDKFHLYPTVDEVSQAFDVLLNGPKKKLD